MSCCFTVSTLFEHVSWVGTDVEVSSLLLFGTH
jgi:hypothetical protein